MFHSENSEDFNEETGCMKWLNEFSEYHEKLLKEELNKLQQLYPEATIIHANYNGASLDIFRSAEQYGEFFCTQLCVNGYYNKFQIHLKVFCAQTN